MIGFIKLGCVHSFFTARYCYETYVSRSLTRFRREVRGSGNHQRRRAGVPAKSRQRRAEEDRMKSQGDDRGDWKSPFLAKAGKHP